MRSHEKPKQGFFCRLLCCSSRSSSLESINDKRLYANTVLASDSKTSQQYSVIGSDDDGLETPIFQSTGQVVGTEAYNSCIHEDNTTSPNYTDWLSYPIKTAKQRAKSEVIHFQALMRTSKAPFPPISKIQQHFEQYGKVVEVIQTRFPTGKVTFRTVKEAEIALTAPEHVINGCKFQLVSCKRRNRCGRKVDNIKCIFFKTLDKETKTSTPSSRALQEYFQSFGTIKSFNRDHRKRIGYVAFETSEGAHKVLSISKHFVNGCELEVAIPKRDPFKRSVRRKGSLSNEENTNDVETRGKILKFQAYPKKSKAPCPPPVAVERYFRNFGRLLDFQWHPQSCSGLLTFHSPNSVRIALDYPEHVVDGCIIKLSPCKARSVKRGSNEHIKSSNVQFKSSAYQPLLTISNFDPSVKRDSRLGFFNPLRPNW
nr:heterogeneous nuclear ribonucleoprotein A0 [Hymenolepis microstoma]